MINWMKRIGMHASGLHALLFGALGIIAAPVFAEQMQSVTISVTVRDSQGAPLPSVPLDVGILSDGKLVQSGLDGTAVAQIDVDKGETFITARLSSGAYYDLSDEQRWLFISSYQQYVENYAFKHRYLEALRPGQTEYHIDITAHDSISATLAPILGGQWRAAAAAFVRGGAWGEYFPSTKPFVVRGLKKGAPGQVFIQTENMQIHVIDLTAAQTAADIDLGIVAVDMATEQSELHLNVADVADLWGPEHTLLDYQVALIRDDAEVIYTFPLHPEESWAYTRIAGGIVARPTIAEGTYYLSPGVFGHPLALRVFDHVRAGNLALLDALNVPKITVVADEQTNATLDAPAAKAAILALPTP
ncbi:MAG: hypothetical protein EA376_04330 [Phycisphaeraceae bacterium]|nr:MAG: hypothetical protein EA376_04330 [Phycisphaeraceae bacterium]